MTMTPRRWMTQIQVRAGSYGQCNGCAAACAKKSHHLSAHAANTQPHITAAQTIANSLDTNQARPRSCIQIIHHSTQTPALWVVIA